MKTTTPVLLSLLLAVTGLLLSISAQDTNLTIGEVPTLVLQNQTLPINSSIDVISVNASSGPVAVPSVPEISVIAVAPTGEGLVNTTGTVVVPVTTVDPILDANNASSPISSGNTTVSTKENIQVGAPDSSTDLSNLTSIPVDNQTTSAQPLPISPDASGSNTSAPTQPSVSKDTQNSSTGNSTGNNTIQTSDQGSNSSNVEQPPVVQVNSTDASAIANVSSNSSSDNITQSTDLFNNASVNPSSDNNKSVAVNSTSDVVIPIMNVTTQDNSNNFMNTTQPEVGGNITVIANLTTQDNSSDFTNTTQPAVVVANITVITNLTNQDNSSDSTNTTQPPVVGNITVNANLTTQENSSDSKNTTQPTVVANISVIANLITPNTTTLVINTTIVKNGSWNNKTVEDEVYSGRENKVKGAIIGSVLGFIGLIVCICVFSARLRRWCRNVITGHETEEDQDVSNVKTIDERQIEEQIQKNSTITVRTKLRLNQMLGCSFFNTGSGTIPTQPKQEKDNSGPDEENGIENDSNSNSMNQELPKQPKKGDKALSDQHKKTQRESHQHILESESDSQNSMDHLKGEEGSSVMRIETQIHKMETRHEILTEKKTHQKDSEEYESEELSRSEKSFENNNNNINEEDMRDQQIFEDNEAQEVVVQRPKKPTTQ